MAGRTGRGGRAGHVGLGRISVLTAHGGHVAGLDLGPEGTGDLAVAELAEGVLEGAEGTVGVAAAAAAVRGMTALVVVAAQNVVLAGLDGFRAQGVDVVDILGFLGPPADGLEHLAMDLDVVVANGGVVEGAQDVIDDLVDGDAGILPRINNTASKEVRVKKAIKNLGGKTSTHGTTYWRIVVATRPAQELRILVKWSLESIECVGSVQVGTFQGSN